MGSFDKYSNYNENTSFSSIVFGAEKPILEVELNELQQIFDSKIAKICSVLGAGFYPIVDGNVVLSSTTVTVSGGIIVTSNGQLAVINESCSVTVSTSNPYVYFEVSEIDVTKDTELRAYGNTSGTVIDNTIQDSRFPVETTRRKALIYTLKAGVKANLTGVNYVGVGIYSKNNNSFTIERVGIEKLLYSIPFVAPLSNPSFTGSISLGRKASTTVGTNSVSLGTNNTASAESSFAQGEGNTAKGLRSVAMGYNNTANGSYSFAMGNNNTAGATGSVALGYKTNSSVDYSYTEGSNTSATGYYAHAMGTDTTALQNQLVIGCSNDTNIATQNSLSGSGTGSAFVIGNGTSSAKSNAFRVQSDGVTYAKGAYNATGADYAEYFEWADRNSDNEDRRGYFVTFDEEKPNTIRKAKSSDEYILGVVSGNPCIIGNSDECWLGKNLFDEFNTPIYETIEEEIEYEDSETHEITKKTVEVRQHKVNPDYDPDKQYVHRSERPEWSTIGFIGVLPVREDGTCKVGGYCKCNDDGIATFAEPSRFNYRVVERVSENVVKVVIK